MPKPTEEQQQALDKFRKAFPGVWEAVVELFGDWPTEEESSD